MGKKFDYAKAMARLEEIAVRVEDPKTSLDDSLISDKSERYFSLLEKSMDRDALSSCADLMKRIDSAINEQCLGQFQEGQVSGAPGGRFFV